MLTDTSLTVRHIFENNHNWGAFYLAEKDNLRDVEIAEVNKMLSCKDESRGFFAYRCEHCGTTLIVHFGCNSRICSNCGKNHTDKWAKSLQNALFNVPHRHAVLTIPDALWPIVRNNRVLLKVLMDAAITAINDTISR
ncbi:MAG: IS91 family transposase ISMbu9, partial [Candidatus Methanogaster sp.]